MDLEEHSGVLYPQLCTMTEVESSPLLVDHTFPVTKLSLLCIAEEANFSGCWIAANRSDGKRVQVIGCNGSSLCVRAVFLLSVEWKVTKEKTRGITPSQESQDDENVEVNGNNDFVHGIEEGKADRKSCFRTPFKAHWTFLLIKEVIEKTPNMTNRGMKNVAMDYVKSNFMSTSLLQNARTFARSEIFGDPFFLTD